MFGQTFQSTDIAVIFVLVGLELLLSADNALVLAIMVRHLPRDLQQKALLYGLGGAFIFRFAAIMLAKYILALWWLQAVGAFYLLWLPIKHFIHKSSDDTTGKSLSGKGFWPTVIAVEMTDIAFAVDSVLAGVATIKGPDKLWVVYLGAIIGIVALRFAAGYFIRLLERFPALDTMAYVLVGWVGVKLAFMAVHNYAESVVKAGGTPVVNLPAMPTWLFWTVLGTIVVLGTIYAKRSEVKIDDSSPETDAEEVEALLEGETVEPIPGTEVVEEPAPETRS